MFLGSTGGEGGEVVTAVDIEVVTVVGTVTAPIEHAAGKFSTIYYIRKAKPMLQRARAWILITKLRTLTRTASARVQPFVSCTSAVFCPCVHFENQAVRLTNRPLLLTISCFLAMYYFSYILCLLYNAIVDNYLAGHWLGVCRP
jgi:hypothetical protein